MYFFFFLTSPTTQAATSSLVPRNMQGTLMGLEHSLFAVAYMVGPQLGVVGLEAGGVSGLSFICSGVFAGVLLVWATMHDGKSSSTSKAVGAAKKTSSKSLLKKS